MDVEKKLRINNPLTLDNEETGDYGHYDPLLTPPPSNSMQPRSNFSSLDGDDKTPFQIAPVTGYNIAIPALHFSWLKLGILGGASLALIALVLYVERQQIFHSP